MGSQQHTDCYDAKQSKVNAGGSFGFGSMTGSAYLGASIGKTRSNCECVIKQSGLYSGSGGFDISVGKHTQLLGAVIASNADAAKNKLSIETSGVTSGENKATYKSMRAGVNLGMSGAFDIASKGCAHGIGLWALNFGQTSGSDSGTTDAAVAPSTIYVRSDEQLARSNPPKSANAAMVDFTSAIAANRYAYLAPVFTEIGELVKGMNLGVPFK
ncbi:hypothetical protein N5C72_16430 [Achromobacter mucicolens]|uniref:Uncharacterized protein n=1 Tax=Achromobacter mucicolens TaxID=1389922 RepID=A0ABD4YW16_9BURK|nr:hypothetical protein [Achromobacter mucicolens]MDH1179668.1 hypothetical protein [Achromobacter mucicolens]